MTEDNKVTYSTDFQNHEEPPTQEEFEQLMGALSAFDLSFGELMAYLDEWSIFEACAYKAPIKWWSDED